VDNFDKRQAVMAELLRDDGRSDRLIAEKLGGIVSPGLVRKVRRKLEQDGKLKAGRRVGRDGRRRGKPRPSAQAPPLTPGVTYALLNEGGHEELIEIHPSERELPPDAPSQQERPAEAKQERRPTKSKVNRRRKRT